MTAMKTAMKTAIKTLGFLVIKILKQAVAVAVAGEMTSIVIII